jgi:hypothetical protein
MFWECNEGSCLGTTIPIADMGGQFGSCFPDGTADGNDRFHALNCFSDMSTTSGPGYPCEDSPPKAYNVDAGGPFGDCSPDGVCDGNDAFHALNAFQGSTTCSCPSGPAPQLPRPPVVVAEASIQLQVNPHTLLPGESVEVDVYLADSTPDLRGYQLHVGVRGGETGLLDLVDIVVHERKDAAFAGLAAWQAFNIGTRQMVAGIDMAGVETVANAYLATFIFRSSPDAAGAFVIDLLHDESDRSQRTFLFPTPESGKIEVAEAVPAVVEVVAPSARRGRVAAD